MLIKRVLPIVLALVLTACGGDADPSARPPTDSAEPVDTSTTSIATDTTPVPTSDVSDSTVAPPVTTSAPQTPETTTAPETTAAPDACREIVHALGTTCVPASPQRIVTLDALLVLPTLLEVGVVPAGSVSVYDVGDPFQDYLDPAVVEGIETVGSMQTPNIEAIAALDPDLILGTDLVIAPIQSQLEQLAPVVSTRYGFYVPDWLDDARLVADAVGKSDEFEEVVSGLDEHVAETAATLAERGAPFELTRVDMFAGTPLYYRWGCVWFGSFMTEVGLTQPAVQKPDECTPGDYESVIQYPSLEQLEILDADVIAAYQQQAQGADVGADPLAALEATPLWGTLRAVQAGDVHIVGDAWGLGVSVTAAHQILDDLVNEILPA